MLQFGNENNTLTRLFSDKLYSIFISSHESYFQRVSKLNQNLSYYTCWGIAPNFRVRFPIYFHSCDYKIVLVSELTGQLTMDNRQLP